MTHGDLRREASGIILGMVRRKSSVLAVLITSLCAAAHSQEPAASVTFTVDFPAANPSHYEIVIGKDGRGTYTSDGKIDEHSDPMDPAPVDFNLSDNIRAQIFELAKRAHYFAGKIDSGRKDIANTGAKTLAYKDANRSTQATYNYSPLQPVEQLTAIFQGLSTTLEFGRRLSYFHKYEKLALDDELKRMEELQKENSLGDVQAVAPALRAIADDSSVINVSRARALRLLQTAGK